MSSRLLIRADGGTRIGSGHVMRCLALAQGWQRTGGEILFLQADTTPALVHRLQAEGMEAAGLAVTPGSRDDARQTIGRACAFEADWIVADGYGFGAEWQKYINDAGFPLLVLDDYGHAETYHADLILNQNVFAHEQLYPRRGSATRLLLGTRYALLRREFTEWPERRREIPAVARKVLVTLGGGDADNVTGKVIEALKDVSDLEAVVVVGSVNPHLAALEAAITSGDRDNRRIRLVLNPPNMPELMAWADVAITGGGTTLTESAFMGLPSLVVVLADNQAAGADAFDREGAAILLGSAPLLTPAEIARALVSLKSEPEQRRDISLLAYRLVDGQGVARVIEQFDPR